MAVVDHEKLESTRLSNNLEILAGTSGIGKQSRKNF
jgi:putative ribosome biogenesis GTPase RsgA